MREPLLQHPAALFAGALLLWNLFCFFQMGWDKACAKKQRRRIPERRLLWCAALLGAAGSFLGMRAFRHKTRKPPFYWLVPLLFLLQLAVFCWLLFAQSPGNFS